MSDSVNLKFSTKSRQSDKPAKIVNSPENIKEIVDSLKKDFYRKNFVKVNCL